MRKVATKAVSSEACPVLHGTDGLDPVVHEGRVVVTTTIGRRGRITVGPIPEFETFPVREGTRLSNSARLRRTEAQKA